MEARTARKITSVSSPKKSLRIMRRSSRPVLEEMASETSVVPSGQK
jgi:hypothetical protein|tara:strand:- start:66 stop:203 length:138 start_codon:yes stop_codon:yes gene_type:complete